MTKFDLVPVPELAKFSRLDPLVLPPQANPHRMTLDDLKATFVTGAPYERERELIFDTLKLYTRLLEQTFESPTLWIDGGFCTVKDWAAPEDVDVVVFLTEDEYKAVARGDIAPELWSLKHVTSSQPLLSDYPVVRQFGGLIDSHPAFKSQAQLMQWASQWSTVKGPQNRVVPGASKGFVEVTL